MSLSLFLIGWLLDEHHVATGGEVLLFFQSASLGLMVASLVWIFYIALEPVVRRRWPQALVSWSRLLSGEWRDPLVGRDILIGGAVAAASSFVVRVANLMPAWLGYPEAEPMSALPSGSVGIRSFVSTLLNLPVVIVLALGFLVLFFLLRRLLRRDWIVTGAVALILSLISWLAGAPLPVVLLVGPMIASIVVYVPMRFGLLALVTTLFFIPLLDTRPLTLDTSAWYFGVSLATLLFILAVNLAAFRISLGGRRLLSPSED